MIERADDAADALEEAAFLSSLLIGSQRSVIAGLPIRALCEVALRGVEMYAAAVDSARHGLRTIHEMLEVVDAITSLERRMDDAERAATFALTRSEAVDAKLFAIVSRICGECERAVDALTHATFVLRDRLATT